MLGKIASGLDSAGATRPAFLGTFPQVHVMTRKERLTDFSTWTCQLKLVLSLYFKTVRQKWNGERRISLCPSLRVTTEAVLLNH